MVTADRAYNPYNCFVVYVGIVRPSTDTFDIKYDTIYLYFFLEYIIRKDL